jgi:hypothetical protein
VVRLYNHNIFSQLLGCLWWDDVGNDHSTIRSVSVNWWVIAGSLSSQVGSPQPRPGWSAWYFLRKKHVIQLDTNTGLWFGTFWIFPFIGNNDPNWLTHIFQDGYCTTNQMVIICYSEGLNPTWFHGDYEL